MVLSAPSPAIRVPDSASRCSTAAYVSCNFGVRFLPRAFPLPLSGLRFGLPLIKKRPDISGRRSWVVRIKGLEPPRRKASDPKSDVATNYTISANRKTGRHAADEERENPDSGLRQPERRFIFGKDRIKNANRTPRSAESPVFYLFLRVDNIVFGAPEGAAFPKSAPVLLGYAGRGAVRLPGRRVRSLGARPGERCRRGKMLSPQAKSCQQTRP